MQETEKVKWTDKLKSILRRISSILGTIVILCYVFTNIRDGYGGWSIAYIILLGAFISIKEKERLGKMLMIALFFVYYICKKLEFYHIDQGIVINAIILIALIEETIMKAPKYKYLKIICLLLVIPVVAYTNYYIKKDKIIKDTYLERTIVRQLDKDEEKLTIKDLEKVKELSLVEDEVKELEGIEYLKNLKKLEIDCDDLDEYFQLGDLTNLETLWIYDVKGKHLSFLEKLKNLKELHISFDDHHTENIILPRNLKKLKITKGKNIDIGFIKSGTNLEELDLSEREIKDFRPLLNLKHLKKLNISYTNMESLEVIGKLTSLEELDVSKTIVSTTKNGIKDLDGLKNLTNLKKLNLYYNIGIEDISPIGNLTNLEELNLSQCRVKDFKSLENLTNLKVLNMDDNRPYDTKIKQLIYPINVEGVGNLKSLKELHINGLGIKNLGFIKELQGLETLYAERNEIENIEELQGLTSLRYVSLNKNKIKDITPIAELTNMEGLDLGKNHIEDVSSLKKLVNLRELNLNYNQIVNVRPLRNLKKLEWLGLYKNNIIDYSPLKALDKIYQDYVKN